MPRLRIGLLALVAAITFASRLTAQSVLYAENAGQMLLVRGAIGLSPLVEVGGKLVFASAKQLALGQGGEYLPVYIDVQHMVATSRVAHYQSGAVFSEFVFKADLVSPYRLDGVFMVQEIKFADNTTALFLHEVGDLKPYKPFSLSLPLHIDAKISPGSQFHMHFFVGGQEVLRPDLAPAEQEKIIDQMVEKRIAGVVNAGPMRFTGPDPAYPEKQFKEGVDGEASVKFRIGTRGEVLDPTVSHASDPAFGQAALAAVQQWHFIPKIRDGRPIEATVEVPLAFKTPKSQVPRLFSQP
jgi:TonB family protein